MRNVVDQLLGAQIPVLSWWALVSTLTKAATTLTMLAILIARHRGCISHGETTVGGIVMFMSFASMLIQRLEQTVEIRQPHCSRMRPGSRNFSACSTPYRACGIGNGAVTLEKIRGAVAFEDVTLLI